MGSALNTTKKFLGKIIWSEVEKQMENNSISLNQIKDKEDITKLDVSTMLDILSKELCFTNDIRTRQIK